MNYMWRFFRDDDDARDSIYDAVVSIIENDTFHGRKSEELTKHPEPHTFSIGAGRKRPYVTVSRVKNEVRVELGTGLPGRVFADNLAKTLTEKFKDIPQKLEV